MPDELLVDRVTGTPSQLRRQPLSRDEARRAATDFIAIGEQIFTGQVVAATNCQDCRGAQGQGGVRRRP